MHAYRIVALIALVCAARPVLADVDGAVRDAAVRVDYGFFTADLGLVLAARDGLGARVEDGWHAYVAAYAAYRAASLRRARGLQPGELTHECERAAEVATGLADARSEALVLASACAAVAAEAEPLRAVLHWRRARQAFAEAESLDADNPRLALIAWLHPGVSGASERVDPARLAEAFRASGIDDFPAWGEAEALLLLGRNRIDAGDIRGARDALEEALLIAPDYLAARELEQTISRLARKD